MIGTIQFQLTDDDGVTMLDVAATLGDDGVWTSANKPLVEYLTENFDPRGREYKSPSVGRFGARALQDAAADLEGTATLAPAKEPEVPGRVY